MVCLLVWGCFSPGLTVAVLLIVFSQSGRIFFNFARESGIELRKSGLAQQGRNAQTDGRGVFTGVRYHHVFMAGGLLVEFVTKHSGGRMSEILAEKTGMDWYAVQVFGRL